MLIKVLDSLTDVSAQAWNGLNPSRYPFLRHEFLHALERNHCLREHTGWHPQHLLAYADDGQIIGAMPLYIKDNSFGEFVFDWSWADAYHRHGLEYYPKLVCAIPFTPATGPRLLAKPDDNQNAITSGLISAALQLAQKQQCSSMHCLFPLEGDINALNQHDFTTRLGCQYHWYNQDFMSFNEFLNALNSKRRKNIRRERRIVQDTNIKLKTISGDQASEADWVAMHSFYSNTFFERGRRPPLTLDFFLEIAATMGNQIVLVLAYRSGITHETLIAGAISFRDDQALYGRHWGSLAEYDSLHFEVCYYQNIDYCITKSLQRFEPGAQGEHKIWRGFLPTLTYSAHWIAHPSFAAAIKDFLRRETPAIQQYAQELLAHTPYRQSCVVPDSE